MSFKLNKDFRRNVNPVTRAMIRNKQKGILSVEKSGCGGINGLGIVVSYTTACQVDVGESPRFE